MNMQAGQALSNFGDDFAMVGSDGPNPLLAAAVMKSGFGVTMETTNPGMTNDFANANAGIRMSGNTVRPANQAPEMDNTNRIQGPANKTPSLG